MRYDTNLQYDPDLGEGPCHECESLEKELAKLKSLHAKTLDEHGRMAACISNIKELGSVNHWLSFEAYEITDDRMQLQNWLIVGAERHEKNNAS